MQCLQLDSPEPKSLKPIERTAAPVRKSLALLFADSQFQAIPPKLPPHSSRASIERNLRSRSYSTTDPLGDPREIRSTSKSIQYDPSYRKEEKNSETKNGDTLNSLLPVPEKVLCRFRHKLSNSSAVRQEEIRLTLHI